MKKIVKYLFVAPAMLLMLTALLSAACNTSNQTTTSTNNSSPVIIGTDWVFTPNTALPQNGRTRQLTGGYSVTASSNKLIVYLPYFGQAYAGADVFSGRGALDFSSTNFTLDKQAAKKGGWNITIKPKDYSEVQSMEFTFYDNGTAYLSVSMTNRSSISFNGSVEAVKS